MRTVRHVRMTLPGTRVRLYEVDIVEHPGPREARFLVNFRYGWEGGALEEGTRTSDPVTESDALRIFDSVIAARQNQGYRLASDPTPRPEQPTLTVVTPTTHPRDAILARRLRALETMPDVKAASLLHRIGEVRLTSEFDTVARVVDALCRDGRRLAALRTLPYMVHRCDDTSRRADPLLERLSTVADLATAETALMLRTVRDKALVPPWDLYPPLLQSALRMPEADLRASAALAFFQSSIAAFNAKHPDAGDAEKALRMLYAHGFHEPVARELVLGVLRAAPLMPPLFRAMRRILQVAEATDDAAVFALLNARFDNDRETSIPVAIDPANPRRGVRETYGARTRRYLRRRGWRTLRRRAEIGDASYVTFAEAILATLDDRHETAMASPPFQDRYAAHKIMHGASARIAASEHALRWRHGGPPTPATTREEPYAALWSAHPDVLWRVLRNARTLDVAGFAARALQDCPAFIDAMPTSDIAALLASWQPYAPRLDLAIAMAERRIARDGLSTPLAAALIGEPTRGGALMRLFLAARPELLAADPLLFATLLSHAAAENYAWLEPVVLKAAAAATADQRRSVVAHVFADMDEAGWPDDALPRAKALCDVLTTGFQAELAALDPARLRAFSQSHALPLQYIAARVASVRADGAELVDVAAFVKSGNAEIRAAGIALFAQRPLDALTADLDTVAAFLTADDHAPRLAARPIAARLQRDAPEAARALAEKLIPVLYRAEAHDGLRDDVYTVLTEDLKPSVAALGTETTWTLLRARAEPARRLGAAVVEAFGPRDFSVRQLARIACNDQVRARRFALAALQARIEDLRAAPEEGFAILDSTFEETRDAGYALYRTHLQPEDWTPTALVALADSTTEPAQRFGREMIGKVFEAKNADFLLGRLAEHPAPGFRLLVSRLMRDYVQDDTQRLKKLLPAIETTLLQVRRGRAAKHQVLSFIEEQLARPGAERAAMLAPVLEKTVATCAIDDRARLLALLTAIKRRDPALAPRVMLVPREAR